LREVAAATVAQVGFFGGPLGVTAVAAAELLRVAAELRGAAAELRGAAVAAAEFLDSAAKAAVVCSSVGK